LFLAQTRVSRSSLALLPVSRVELPLIGLLEDSILPGEERNFTAPVVDATALAALARAAAEPDAQGKRLFALTIASALELPSLVTARWGTECAIVAATADGASITLRGLRRGRLVSARGKESPYRAEVDADADASGGPALADLVAAAHGLTAALEVGALDAVTESPERLSAAIFALGRAATPKDLVPELAQHPPAEAMRRLTQALAARAPGEHASCVLEQQIRALMDKPELPKALRQRLWSQVVEIQRRLDVYDPTVAEEGDDVARLQRRLMQAGLPKGAREVAKRELRLLRSMQSNHHDYSTYLAHLEFMARLPWQPDPHRDIDLDAVQAALDRAHFGLDKAKQRVLEYLAVRALGGESASMILCLSGPPGVGKTSIARAIAEALGRPFVRVPLGGVHDESEIRGHRLSFVAASGGRVLKGIAQAGSASALVLLDELDKIGADRQRSPMAALLEVLDPEQNDHFQDNYLGIPYDLSHVLFVATANDTQLMHPTLLDRMEPVEIEGYTAHEKTTIARTHLIPRLRAEHGLPDAPTVDEDALTLVIEGHTRESGVRQLRRALASVFRSRALALVRARGAQGAQAQAEWPGLPVSVKAPMDLSGRPVTRAEVAEVLGPPRFAVQRVSESLPVGVATGLSVGTAGGALMLVEVGLMPGKGDLALTGRLGEVLQESVRAALAHLRVAPDRYGVDRARLAASDVHLHLPEAATAKDGPSAGTAVFAALVSALAGMRLPADLALTGEISLTGRVLPVGGVRAKLLAAERAGIRRVILPEDNRADVPADLALEIVFTRSLDEVLRSALPELSFAAGDAGKEQPQKEG
jgi:ATP-dependent Lon protease